MTATAVLEDVAGLSWDERQRLLDMLHSMARDEAYKQTPIGQEVVRYLEHKKWKGLDPRTLEAREGWLYKFVDQHKAMTLQGFTGQRGGALIEEFLIRNWGEQASGTRANRTSGMRDFFKWAYRAELVDKNPMDFVDTPSRGGRRRDSHDRAEIVKLITAQPRWRDRLCIALMARQAFRKNELRTLQLGHFDFAHRTVSIFGKGSKFAVADLFDDLAEDLERYVQERAYQDERGWRTEYLLYRIRAYRRGSYPNYVQEEKHVRDAPLTQTGMQWWWEACVSRAGLDRFPMHELRHTAGTDFHKQVGDYDLTRQFMRHENVATTATYIHVGKEHLRAAMKKIPGYWATEQDA